MKCHTLKSTQTQLLAEEDFTANMEMLSNRTTNGILPQFCKCHINLSHPPLHQHYCSLPGCSCNFKMLTRTSLCRCCIAGFCNCCTKCCGVISPSFSPAETIYIALTNTEVKECMWTLICGMASLSMCCWQHCCVILYTSRHIICVFNIS